MNPHQSDHVDDRQSPTRPPGVLGSEVSDADALADVLDAYRRNHQAGNHKDRPDWFKAVCPSCCEEAS